jgi:hypothetical protein
LNWTFCQLLLRPKKNPIARKYKPIYSKGGLLKLSLKYWDRLCIITSKNTLELI